MKSSQRKTLIIIINYNREIHNNVIIYIVKNIIIYFVLVFPIVFEYYIYIINKVINEIE